MITLVRRTETVEFHFLPDLFDPFQNFSQMQFIKATHIDYNEVLSRNSMHTFILIECRIKISKFNHIFYITILASAFIQSLLHVY